MKTTKPPRSEYRYAVERLKWKNRNDETRERRWSGCKNGLARFVFRQDAERFLELYAEGITRAVHEGCVPRTFALRIVELPRDGQPKKCIYERHLWRRTKSVNEDASA